MSYAQAMHWQKKHPRGGKAQYMGFDAGCRTGEPTPRVSLLLIEPRGVWDVIRNEAGEPEAMLLPEAFKRFPSARKFMDPGVFGKSYNGAAYTELQPLHRRKRK